MYENAVLALVLSHPRPDLLGPTLEDHLSRVEAGIVAVSNTEEHLQGAQAVQQLLMLAQAESAERFLTALAADTAVQNGYGLPLPT